MARTQKFAGIILTKEVDVAVKWGTQILVSAGDNPKEGYWKHRAVTMAQSLVE